MNERIIYFTGLIIWIPFIIVILIFKHLFKVSCVYYKIFRMPYIPYKIDNPSLKQKLLFYFIYPHSWCWEDSLSFNINGEKYYIVGKD